MKDVLKCATTNSGVLSVTMDGELLMLMWLADRLDSLDSVTFVDHVCLLISYHYAYRCYCS